MGKSSKIIVIVIGCLSIISSIFELSQGESFSEVVLGFIIGVSLIGTILLDKKQ
tara:strand:+ start:664 stop:825 length:162 start_codon:yes stop_codon:yes gene_type:complete